MLSSDSAFNTAVFRALCACLELQPSSEEASALLRPFPNDPESPPPPPRSVNVVYYDIRPEEAPDAGYQVYAPEDATVCAARSAASIVATPHSGDRSFRLTSAPANFPPQAVVGASPCVSSFLPYRLILICYGPDCEQYAHRVRSFLFLDGSGYPRSILRQAGIYPVPRPAMPVLIDEEEGNLLRRRADLVISLRAADTLVRTGRRYSVSEPPAVVIRE